jgi:hypothetical protein
MATNNLQTKQPSPNAAKPYKGMAMEGLSLDYLMDLQAYAA